MKTKNLYRPVNLFETDDYAEAPSKKINVTLYIWARKFFLKDYFICTQRACDRKISKQGHVSIELPSNISNKIAVVDSMGRIAIEKPFYISYYPARYSKK